MQIYAFAHGALFQFEILVAHTYVCSPDSIHISIWSTILILFTCGSVHLHVTKVLWFVDQMSYLSSISGIRSGFGALDKVYSTCQNSAW